MNTQLSRRIATAMARGYPTPRERARVVDAVQKADSFEDLPKAIRQLIAGWEKA